MEGNIADYRMVFMVDNWIVVLPKKLIGFLLDFSGKNTTTIILLTNTCNCLNEQ